VTTAEATRDEDDDQYEQAVTLDGWRALVNKDYAKPTLLAPAEYHQLTSPERADYDAMRLEYHREPRPLGIPTFSKVLHQGRKQYQNNVRHQGARPGLVISGDGGVGKSTALRGLGIAIEVRWRQMHPNSQDAVPVVYISLPGGTRPKGLAIAFLRFFGVPYKDRDTELTLGGQACDLMRSLRTSLVLVDEIHNLNHKNNAGAEISDHLKYFTEHVPATFVLAGIDVVGRGLFSGRRGAQLARRFRMLRVEPINYGSDDEQHEWHRVIEQFEHSLLLFKHRPGTLVKQAKYLFDRTGGVITSLSSLIREAAVDAIVDGSESIVRDHLENVLLDHAAEEQATELRRRAAAAKRASTKNKTKEKPPTTPSTSRPAPEIAPTP
jgi:Bacterial TniB protein